MFEFERFLAYFLTPFPIIILLLVVGTVLIFTKNKLFIGKIIILISVGLMLLLSTFKIPQAIRLSLEDNYPSYTNKLSDIRNDIANTGRNIKWIVVLAGGTTDDTKLSVVDNLSNSTIKRLCEGIILNKKFKGSKLILSGGNPDNAIRKEADYMRDFCLQLGISKEDIIIERKSKDTYSQANEVKKIVRNHKFILVSSVTHFPRAELMFKKVGLNPIVFPTDFKPKPDYHWYDYLPDAGGFATAKELLISFWAYIGAWIKNQI